MTYTSTPNKKLKPRINAIVEQINGGRVLDVGAVGQGTSIEDRNWLHGHLDQVADKLIGIDIQKTEVENLQALGWDIRYDDAESLKSIKEPVDYVVAAEVIEHLGAPGDFLKRSKEILASDGKILLTTPNPWAVVYLRRVLSGKDPVGNKEHTCWFDETTLSQLAQRYGLVMNVFYIPPVTFGVTSFVYRLNPKLGGTRLLAVLTLE